MMKPQLFLLGSMGMESRKEINIVYYNCSKRSLHVLWLIIPSLLYPTAEMGNYSIPEFVHFTSQQSKSAQWWEIQEMSMYACLKILPVLQLVISCTNLHIYFPLFLKKKKSNNQLYFQHTVYNLKVLCPYSMFP